MKRMNMLTLLMFFALIGSQAFAANAESKSNATSKEVVTELSSAEMNSLSARVVEIRDMDKSNLSSVEKSELKSELKEIKDTMKRSPYIYVGGSTLILIIILLIILF